jgi:hypothetical protein
MRRGFAQLGPNRPADGGSAALWLGVNFWSRVGGPRMWPRYDRQTVAKELQVLADHGLTVTRSFFFWPDTPGGCTGRWPTRPAYARRWRSASRACSSTAWNARTGSGSCG